MSATIEKLQKTIEVLSSSHVSSVAVSYDYESDSIRYYTAITQRHGAAHRYTVRVQDWFEDGEKQVWAKCSCQAAAKNLACRHVLRVAEIDSNRFDRDLYLETFTNYKAHHCYAKKAMEAAA